MVKVKDYEVEASIVPELFFDVIARIIPGIIILFIFQINQVNNHDNLLQEIVKILPSQAPAFRIISTIFIAYILGLLIHQLYPIIESTLGSLLKFPIKPILFFVINFFLVIINIIIVFSRIIPSVSPTIFSLILYDDFLTNYSNNITNQEIYILRKNFPSLASTLLKIQAEITFSEVMITSATLIILTSITNKVFNFPPESFSFLIAPSKGVIVVYGIIMTLFIILRNNLERLSIESRDELSKQLKVHIDISSYWPQNKTLTDVYTNTTYPHGSLTHFQLKKARDGELLIENLNTTHLEDLIKFAKLQDSTVTLQDILKVI